MNDERILALAALLREARLTAQSRSHQGLRGSYIQRDVVLFVRQELLAARS